MLVPVGGGVALVLIFQKIGFWASLTLHHMAWMWLRQDQGFMVQPVLRFVQAPGLERRSTATNLSG
jgi:hypothetical protein